jgi:hypothetical protein
LRRGAKEMSDDGQPKMTEFANRTELRGKLHELEVEHRDLDEVIDRLESLPPHDDLLLRRLKKRKLLLKDRISLIEGMLEPDIPA